MNKKANIPIVILVIGVLAVCGLAFLSFSFSNHKIEKNFSDISAVQNIRVDKEKLGFYTEKLGFSEAEADKLLDVKNNEQYGRYLYVDTETIDIIYQLP